MTFKISLLGTVAAVALALPTVAQTTTSEPEVATDIECSGEVVDGVCSDDAMGTETGAEGDPAAETDADMAEETEADTATEMEADIAAETDVDTATETDTGMSTDVEEQTEADTMAVDTETPVERNVRDATAFAGMTVSQVVGMPVESADAQDVGEIDYIYQASDGHEAVIGIGGFLGLGEYTVAVPLGAFTMDPERSVLILDGFTEEELESMPEIDESELEALPGEYVIG